MKKLIVLVTVASLAAAAQAAPLGYWPMDALDNDTLVDAAGGVGDAQRVEIDDGNQTPDTGIALGEVPPALMGRTDRTPASLLFSPDSDEYFLTDTAQFPMALIGNPAVTISFWVKPMVPADVEWDAYSSFGGNTQNNNGRVLTLYRNLDYAYATFGNGNVRTADTTLPAQQWHHVVYSRDGNHNTSQFWINGNNSPITATTGPNSSLDIRHPDVGESPAFAIGGRTVVNEDYLTRNAYLAEMAIWNRVLSDTEIQLLNSGVSPLNIERIRPWNPSPEDGATGLDPVTTTTLSWNIARDPNNLDEFYPGVTGHYVRLFDVDENGDPNLTAYTTTAISGLDEPVEMPITLDFDDVIYWRVDTSINESGPDDPETLIGNLWSFEMLKSVPVVTAQPVGQVVDPGQGAEFTVSATSLTPIHYQWYHSPDRQMDPETDTPVGEDSATLVLDNIQPHDEGYYYCRLINEGNQDWPVFTAAAPLGVRRLVTHWTLDLADYDSANGLYLDSSGYQRHAAALQAPPIEAFVPGVEPTATNEGLDLGTYQNAIGLAGSQSPAEFTDEMSISVWLKWAGVNNNWQGIVSKRHQNIGGDWFWQITGAGDEIRINSWGAGADRLDADPPIVDEWTHMVLTVSADGGVLYRDGQVDVVQPGFAIDQTEAELLIGGIGKDPDGTVQDNAFNGILDDIRIFNYALDAFGVADLNYDVAETAFCLNPDNVDLSFDLTGDCRVGIGDFAIFISEWLECGLHPEHYCP